MKKLFPILITVLLFSSVTFAQKRTATTLNIYSNKEPFTVSINGVAQNNKPYSYVKLSDVRRTHFQLTIHFINSRISDIHKNMYLKQGEKELFFELQRNGRRGRYVLKEKQPGRYHTYGWERNRNHRKVRHQGYGQNNYPVGHRHQNKQYTGQYRNGNCSVPPISVGKFEVMKNSISKRSFSSDRLKLAKQIIAENCFTANQVKQLVLLFTFSSAKVEIAKYAYLHTADPENYFVVNDAFTFSSSIDELHEYIQSVK